MRVGGLSPVGTHKTALETPALLVDLDAMDRNMARMVATIRRAGVSWRPHTKGQKIPALAHRMLAAGAIGVTCAKVSEAEVMADAGIWDILIANQVIGEAKVRRLAYLCSHADVAVAVDSAFGVDQLARAAGAAGTRPRVVVEVDLGMGRCGVTPGEAVVALAQRIAGSPPLRFAGVMGWEGHCAAIADQDQKRAEITAAIRRLTSSADACRAAGLPVEIVSCGGTGTYPFTAFEPGVTEVQAGGGIFGDVHYRDDFHIDHECALTGITMVVSRPNPRLIVTDGGFKTFNPLNGTPRPLGLPEGIVERVALSAEHGRVFLKEPLEHPAVGETLEFVVGYSDSTVFQHDVLYGTRDGIVQVAWEISGRGKIQ